MLQSHFHAAMLAALTVGLGLGTAATLQAQPGPGLSSGSGAGTGTGASSTIGRNQSGSVSGVGPGPASGIQGSANNPLLPRGPVPPGMAVPLGPGVNTTFPDDTGLFPLTPMVGSREGNPSELSMVQDRQFEAARKIDAPGDRSMALQRIANAAIFSNQLPMAHTALVEAAEAGLLEQNRLVHDQRLVAIVTTYSTLAEAHLREGKVDLSIPEFDNETDPNPIPKADHSILIRRAGAEWQRAATLSGQILNPTYKNEMLYRVVDAMSYGSQTIINDFPTQASSPAETTTNSVSGPADQILRDAVDVAKRIERPVWRDRALVAISSAAASSRQFARGLEVARMIPQPEVRTDALLRLAEAQARRDDAAGATGTYREAAKAVASIPLDAPRVVLAGVLIDNLISVGRFEDARASIGLIPDTARQIIALGAIAESQGRRGAAESALGWIARDVAPEYRSQLYRRLNNGVLTAIEQNRSRDLSNRDR
jgi:hypothetical protein